MKIIGIEDQEEQKKQINRKRIIIVSAVVLLILVIVTIICVYMGNKSFRDFIDRYVLMKNITENNLPTINLDNAENSNIFAYDKYISLFGNNTLTGYNSSGNKEYELTVEITNPIVSTNNRFILMAEKNAQKIYLISGKEIVWQKQLDGNISRVSVNKNGYVSVVITGTTTHKSIIEIFDATGKELFKIYRANTIVMDTDISFDNKYISFAEISTEGTLIKSMIKTISIQKAQETPSESTVYSIDSPSNSIPINMKYQDNNKLVCMYDDSIHIIQNDKDEELVKLNEDNKKISISDIELNNYIFRVTEKSELLKTTTLVEMINVGNKGINLYTLEGVAKEVYSYNDIIALNLGSEVHFIKSSGWLDKKYTSSQEVRKIVIANNFAGIVYRDKIEIVNL